MLSNQNTIEFPAWDLEFTIDPVAFSVGSVKIYWYALFITLGMVLAFFYAYRNSKRFKLDSDKLLDAAIVGVIAGVIGARLYYILFSLDNYDTFASLFNLKNGGLAIPGGLIFGLGAGVLVAKWRKLSIGGVLDIGALGFLIGQALGRWGNFTNQEAFGVNTTLPWGMTGDRISAYLRTNSAEFSANGITVNPLQPVHPCFLYESLWCLLGFIILHFVSRKRKFPGQIFLMYIGWYGLGRFFIEGLRTDSLYIPDTTLRVSQLLAALAVVVSVIGLIILFLRAKDTKELETEYQSVFGMMEDATPEAMRIHAAELSAQAAQLRTLAGTLREQTGTLDEDEIRVLLGEEDPDESEEEAMPTDGMDPDPDDDLDYEFDEDEESPEDLEQEAEELERKAAALLECAARAEEEAEKAAERNRLRAKAATLRHRAEELEMQAKTLRETSGSEEDAEGLENEEPSDGENPEKTSAELDAEAEECRRQADEIDRMLQEKEEQEDEAAGSEE